MWYRIQRTIACLTAILGLAVGTSSAQAGWGHHHHHHHYGSYYGGYGGWGLPSYGYSSFSLSISRPRFYAPAYGYGYGYNYPPLGYSSYGVGYYSSYYTPRISYSVALPSYYYAPSYYVAPSYYSAPSVSPSYSNCCDPCASSISYPSTVAPLATPSYSQPEYSTGLGAPVVASPQVASSGSFVDRMLGRGTPASIMAPRATSSTPNQVASNSMTPTPASAGAVRTVSTLKPIAPSTVAPTNRERLSIDQLTAIPDALLKMADDMFAMGGYQQAAAAYARLAVRYGNHDELAVRRFIALVANGDHDQASIVLELAMVNGRPLSASALPVGGLTSLYGGGAASRQNHIESLAAYALKASDNALPLNMVGTWLELDGQHERAATFLKRAEMISNSSEATTSPTLAHRLADGSLAR